MNLPNNQPATIVTFEVIALIPWTDHPADVFGHDPRSAYVEQFWLATLGPSTTWFLRHCVALLEGTDGAAVNLRETASALGIGYAGGARSAMAKTVIRACRFRAARPVGSATLAVRLRLPPLSHRQVQRLPEWLQRRHQEFIAASAGTDAFTQQLRARRVASSLIESGDSISEAELHLGHLRFHPSIAAEAASWAWNHRHGGTPPDAA